MVAEIKLIEESILANAIEQLSSDKSQTSIHTLDTFCNQCSVERRAGPKEYLI